MIALRPTAPGPRRTISVSQVQAIQACSLKHAYRYVERRPEESRGAALVIGSVLDVCAKRVVTGIKAGDFPLDAIPLAALFGAAWDAEVGRSSVPILWGAKGPEAALATAQGLLQTFCSLPDLASRIDTIQATDVRFEIPLMDPINGVEVPGVVVVGVVDFVQRLPDGRIRMMELKTAANRAAYDEGDLEFNLQAGVYQMALRYLHGDRVAPEAAWLVGLKTKAAEWIDRLAPIPEASERRALLVLRHAWLEILRGIAYPQPNFLCSTCPYAAACRTWHATPAAEPVVDPFAAEVMSRAP